MICLFLVSCVASTSEKKSVGTFLGYADTSQLSATQKKYSHYFVNGKGFRCYGRFVLSDGKKKDTVTVLLDPDISKNPGDTTQISELKLDSLLVE